MKINIYSIIKPSKDEFDVLIKDFIKMSSKYAKVEVFYIFNMSVFQNYENHIIKNF